MTPEQLYYHDEFKRRMNAIIQETSDESVTDLLDEMQVLYNEDRIANRTYNMVSSMADAFIQ